MCMACGGDREHPGRHKRTLGVNAPRKRKYEGWATRPGSPSSLAVGYIGGFWLFNSSILSLSS